MATRSLGKPSVMRHCGNSSNNCTDRDPGWSCAGTAWLSPTFHRIHSAVKTAVVRREAAGAAFFEFTVKYFPVKLGDSRKSAHKFRPMIIPATPNSNSLQSRSRHPQPSQILAVAAQYEESVRHGDSLDELAIVANRQQSLRGIE